MEKPEGMKNPFQDEKKSSKQVTRNPFEDQQEEKKSPSKQPTTKNPFEDEPANGKKDQLLSKPFEDNKQPAKKVEPKKEMEQTLAKTLKTSIDENAKDDNMFQLEESM